VYEHFRQRLLEWPDFVRRARRHLFWGLAILFAVDGAGAFGYHLTGLRWIDAFHNASMILSGMGPVDRMETAGAKVFASFYALASGLVFAGVFSIMAAPWVHRVFHRLHLDDETTEDCG
jgi:hypothetical protein